MKMDYHFKIVAIVFIVCVVVGGVFLILLLICCGMNKKQKLRLPEPPQWQPRMIVSDPTHQPRGIHVDNGVVHLTIGSPKDRSRGRSDTIVKPVVPLMPYAVDDSLRNKGPKELGKLQGKRDDGGLAVMTAASTSAAFSGGCGGGGDSGCGCSGGGSGAGDDSGGGGGGCGSC